MPRIARRDAHHVASIQPRNTLTSHDARAPSRDARVRKPHVALSLGCRRPAETRSYGLGAGDRPLRTFEIAEVDRPQGIHRGELERLDHPAGRGGLQRRARSGPELGDINRESMVLGERYSTSRGESELRDRPLEEDEREEKPDEVRWHRQRVAVDGEVQVAKSLDPDVWIHGQRPAL